jgi:hypothetical protein
MEDLFYPKNNGDRKAELNRELDAVLKRGKATKRNWKSLLESFQAGDHVVIPRSNRALARIKKFFDNTSKKKNARARVLYSEMLLYLDDQGCKKLLKSELHVAGIGHIALLNWALVRDPMTWKRTSRNIDRQVQSFANHCFAKYVVPDCLSDVWAADSKAKHRAWYLWIGQGKNIRARTDLPLHLTKKMAHLIPDVPKQFAMEEALRWVQVLGLGGDRELAQKILASPLGRNDFQYEEFACTLIQFFIANPMIAQNKLSELVDFAMTQHTTDAAFSLKGRTAISLVRLSDEWHRQQTRVSGKFVHYHWSPSGIPGYFQDVRKDDEQYSLYAEELCTSHGLMEEGQRMRHCVFSYANQCRANQSTIFSIRIYQGGKERRLATVEVNLRSRTIVQAQAKSNGSMSARARRTMVNWARESNLAISQYA